MSRALVVEHSVRAFRREPIRRALDLGAAEGSTLVELRRLLPRVESWTGVEASGELVEQAGAGLPSGVRVVLGDVCRLPAQWTSEAFDLVTALAILEHLEEPERAVAEATRCMASGALFVTTCPHPTWDRLATRLGLLDDDQHAVQLDLSGLVQTVERGGLDVLHADVFMFAPIGFLPYLRIPFPPATAAKVDGWLRRLGTLQPLFVNQFVVARKR